MLYYWVSMQAPRDIKLAKKIIEKLNTIAVNGVGWDFEFIFKIKKEDWQKVVDICVMHSLNGSVIGETDNIGLGEE